MRRGRVRCGSCGAVRMRGPRIATSVLQEWETLLAQAGAQLATQIPYEHYVYKHSERCEDDPHGSQTQGNCSCPRPAMPVWLSEALTALSKVESDISVRKMRAYTAEKLRNPAPSQKAAALARRGAP